MTLTWCTRTTSPRWSWPRAGERRRVPLVYDAHESGTAAPGGPADPLRRRRERRVERRPSRPAAVITVSQGIADLAPSGTAGGTGAVVRNSFPLAPPPSEGWSGAAEAGPAAPSGAVYAGRIAPYRELETIAAGSATLAPFPVTIMGATEPLPG